MAKIDPVAYHQDHALFSREGNRQFQLDLLRDYETNLELYPRFQEFLKTVPVLAVWGGADPIFGEQGARDFGKVGAEVVVLDGGHFLLETHLEEAAEVVGGFLEKVGAY